MENTYFLLGFYNCSYVVLQKRDESARYTCLFPFSPMTQQKNKTKSSTNFLFASCNWTGMDCAAMCLGQQRRSFGSEIFLSNRSSEHLEWSTVCSTLS